MLFCKLDVTRKLLKSSFGLDPSFEITSKPDAFGKPIGVSVSKSTIKPIELGSQFDKRNIQQYKENHYLSRFANEYGVFGKKESSNGHHY